MTRAETFPSMIHDTPLETGTCSITVTFVVSRQVLRSYNGSKKKDLAGFDARVYYYWAIIADIQGSREKKRLE